MESWVGYAHFVVTTALACIVAFYGRKYGKTFEAAKQAEIEAKNAWIAKLEGELRLLREMNSENMRKHTIAMKEQLDDHIRLLSEELEQEKQTLRTEVEKRELQQTEMDNLNQEIEAKESEIEGLKTLAAPMITLGTIFQGYAALLGAFGANITKPEPPSLLGGDAPLSASSEPQDRPDPNEGTS